MRDKYKAGLELYRRSLQNLPCDTVRSIVAIMLGSGFVISKKSRITGMTRFYHRRDQTIIASFDPRGGKANTGCGLPCIRIYRQMRKDGVFIDGAKAQDVLSFLLIDTINLVYSSAESLENIIYDAKAFFADFNNKIRG